MASRFVEFVTRGIEELRRGLVEVRRVASAASAAARDAARQARVVREQAKAAADESRRQGQKPAPTGGLSQLQDRADRQRGRDLDKAAQAAVTKALGVARRAASFGSGLANLVTSEDEGGLKGLQFGLHTAASLPIPIVRDVAAIMSQVVSVVEAREARQRAALEKFTEERIARAIATADSSRRYEEDPRFRAEEDARAQAIYIARRDASWEPRSGASLEGF